jgi:hypothetical protein
VASGQWWTWSVCGCGGGKWRLMVVVNTLSTQLRCCMATMKILQFQNERENVCQADCPQPTTNTTSWETLMRTRVGMPHASWVTCLADSWWDDEWLSRVRVRRRWHEKQHGFFPGTSGHLGSPRLCSRHLLRHAQVAIMALSVLTMRIRSVSTCAHKLRCACY